MSPIVPQDTPTLFDGKVCSRCGSWKILSDYGCDKRTPDGHTYACRACRLASERAKNEANRDAFTQRQHAYYEAHKEDWVAKRHARKPQQSAIARAWRMRKKQDPDFIERERARNREQKRLHPETSRTHNQRRRAYRKGAEGRFTKAEWINLCTSYGNRCLACGEQKKLTVDHVIPLSQGGTNDIGNIQPLCFSCNASKGAKTIDYRPILES